VLDELRATLALPAPPRPDREALVKRLGSLRARLNGHAAAMRGEVAGKPLHAVIGNLVALRARGVAAPDFRIEAGGWDAARIAQVRDAVRDLAARATEGAPRSAWRGVRAALTATDQERLIARLPGLIRAFAAAGAALAPAAAALGRAAPGPEGAAAILSLGRAVAAAPTHDAAAMADAAWAADPAPLRALAADAAAVAAAERDPRLLPGALTVPGLAEARATLAEAGGVFGFLSGARREAKAVAARVARDAADPVPAMDAALAGQAAAARLAAGEALGRRAFGRLWAGDPGGAHGPGCVAGGAWAGGRRRPRRRPRPARPRAGRGCAGSVAGAGRGNRTRRTRGVWRRRSLLRGHRRPARHLGGRA
jgi:hypothetical protein